MLKSTSWIILVFLLCVPGAAQKTKNPSKPAKKKTLPELVESWKDVREKDYTKRYYHLMAVAAIKSEKSVAFLQRLLKEESNRSTRSYVLMALSKFPESETACKIIKDMVNQTENLADRRSAMSYLRHVDPDWRATLKPLAKSKDRGLASSAINAIANARDEESKKVLLSLYRRKMDIYEKQTVLRALVFNFQGEDIFTKLLRPNLQSSADKVLRDVALQALSQNKDKRFFKYANEHKKRETADYTLANWVTWSVPFNSLQAVRFAVSLLEEDKKTPRCEREFLKAMKTMDSAEVGDWAREKGIKSKLEIVRAAAIANMAKKPRPSDTALLIKLSGETSERISMDAIEALSHHKDEKATRKVAKLVSHKNPFVAAHALKSRFQQMAGSDAVVKECVRIATSSRSWEMRIAAIELLKKKHAEAARKALFSNAKHKSPHVRSAAYDALTYVRDKNVVEFLLSLLKKERGRAKFDLADALADLTGFTWGVKHERWMSWWNRVKDEYPLPPKPKKIKARADDGYAGYYGISVNSNRVAFVIDISGSMSAKVRTTTRLEEAKSNLVAAVRGFHVDVRFNIVAFDNVMEKWVDVLNRATGKNKKSAIAWANELKPRGGTNVYGALMDAMDLDDVDTIFFLSDGAPSAGKVTDTDEILRLIRSRNRFERIRIHTIGVQLRGQMKEFMEKLAAENYGECRVVE